MLDVLCVTTFFACFALSCLVDCIFIVPAWFTVSDKSIRCYCDIGYLGFTLDVWMNWKIEIHFSQQNEDLSRQFFLLVDTR